MLVTIDSKSLTGEELSLDEIFYQGYLGVPIGLDNPVELIREMHLRKALLPTHQALIVSGYNDVLKFWDAATGNTTEYEIEVPNDVDNLVDLCNAITGRMNAVDAAGGWNVTYHESNGQVHIQNGGTHIRFDLRANPFSFVIGWPADTQEDFGVNDLWLPKANPFAERATLYLSFDEIEMDHNVIINALDVPNVFATLFVPSVGENAFIDPDSDFQLPSDFIVVQPTQVPTTILREAGLSITRLTPKLWVMCGSRLLRYNLNSMHFTFELLVHTSQSKDESNEQGLYY